MSLSHNEMKRLLDLVWPEVTEELEVWIEQLRSILENTDDDVSLREIHQAQGSLRALRSVLQLPESLLATKLTNEEEQDGSERRDQEPG